MGAIPISVQFALANIDLFDTVTFEIAITVLADTDDDGIADIEMSMWMILSLWILMIHLCQEPRSSN